MKHPVTPDVTTPSSAGRPWRIANPGLDEAERADLVGRLMEARRPVRGVKKAADPDAAATAHRVVDEVKQALGERGPCGGTTARQISTGTWRRTHFTFTPTGMRN